MARSGRGDAESSVVFGPGVAPPGGMDGLVCAGGCLRPEPPPMHTMCAVWYFVGSCLLTQDINLHL